MEVDEIELNRKLAEWIGFELKRVQCVGMVYYENEQDCWYYKGREFGFNIPNFTNPDIGIALCFKWLVPDECSVSFNRGKHGTTCLLTIPKGRGIYGSSTWIGQANREDALALCLAIEKLIDSKKENTKSETANLS